MNWDEIRKEFETTKITLRELAVKYDIKYPTIKSRNQRQGWCKDASENLKDASTEKDASKKRRGPPKGNKNAVGHGPPVGSKNALGNKGGHGGPYRNDKAVTHGFFRKFLPDDTAEIMEQLETRAPIDMMWDQITIQYAAIIRAQQIMHVKDQEDKTKELKKSKLFTAEKSDSEETEWEIQFAWDKQATFLTAQSRAMTTLQNLIRQYDEMCRQDGVDTERQLRVEKLKKEISILDKKGGSDGSKPPLHIIVDYGDDAS